MSTTEMERIRITANETLKNNIFPLFDEIGELENANFVHGVTICIAVDLIAITVQSLNEPTKDLYFTVLIQNIEERVKGLKAGLKAIETIRKAKN